MTDRHERHKRWFLPETPDVIGMLCDQVSVTADGMVALAAWATGDPTGADRVRAAEHAADDQKRVMSVPEAFVNGADYIVVGRPIRDAADPRAAAEQIQATIAGLFPGR